MNIKSKPYELFGIVALLIFASSFIPTSASVDINLHDTYFVVSGRYVYWLFAIIFWFLWLLYFCFNHILLSQKLTWAHVIFTILPIVIGAIAFFERISLDGIPRRYYAFTEFEDLKPWYRKEILYNIVFVGIVLAQLIFLVNILGGVIKRVLKAVTPL